MSCACRWFGVVTAAALGWGATAPGAADDEPFDYFRNSWNVVGLKDYRFGTRVTPENELLLADGARIEIRHGQADTRLSRKQVKTLVEGWMPIVRLATRDAAVRYDFTIWASPLPAIADWRAAFDWPIQGENFVTWVTIEIVNQGASTAPYRVTFVRQTAKGQQDRTPLDGTLAGGAATKVHRAFLFQPAPEVTIDESTAPLWLQRTAEYWRGVMAKTARIEVPCRKSNEALLAAHVCQLIANDHGELRGGEGFYDDFYIRDGAYQLMEIEEAGLDDVARKAVECYLKRQRPDGRFETQKNQFDANGQAVWVLWQYGKITGDRAWLERVYPRMCRAVEWTVQARRQAPADSPFVGLLPVAPADGEFLWDGKHHIVGYDIWNLRGLLCTADVARTLGKTADAERFEREAKEYRQAIDEACKRLGLAHFPPSWEKDGTHWGNTETLWPTELFDRNDPRVADLIRHARKEHGGGFHEGTIRWLGHAGAIHPYMSAYTTMASLLRGEHEQVVEDYYWYLLHSTASHAFPEGIFYARRFAWSHTIPHVTGASNFALMLRHLLVHESGDELHLLAAVPDGWLAAGQQIRVLGAPTHFGPLSLTVRGQAQGVQVEFVAPKRTPPRRVVLHLPQSRPLLNSLAGVETLVRSDQKQRWDFAEVVRRYQAIAPPASKPIPGLVGLPIEPDLSAAQCTMFDLKPLANTDPFRAPFGVANPGKLLFTDMPTGVRTVGGVPFAIIDPEQNQGRGFVVLHSPHAPKNRQWPRQVEIPVGAPGKRLFFLGNVSGWGRGDAGAVAEYVIEYADGRQQTVPLIPGRTIEDWTAAPEAEDVYAGLRGQPWHLNVLAVTLRAVPVRRILFRDLDTPAAPVLVAVTMEK